MFQFVVLFLHILAIYNAAVIFIRVSLIETTSGGTHVWISASDEENRAGSSSIGLASLVKIMSP